ncbi:hypothetical protein [Undibacterium sp.]|uniref:hypothetical protein n=1 Tax=Undibacterium sp. TaxID=1914977 RepID=UPI00374C9BAA
MNINSPKKIILFGLSSLTLLAAAQACAEDATARHYAALSLIGDSISVTFEVETTGSNLDRNKLQKIDIPNNELDSAALLAVDNAVVKIQPGVKTDLLISNDAGLYRMQGSLFDGSADAGIALDGLKLALKNNPDITHLVLVTKHRGDARLKLQNSSFGHGKLEGLGFYVDNRIRSKRGDTQERGRGMIAPYAYVTVRLIDTHSWTVLAEKTLDNSNSFANAGSDRGDSLNAWDALTAAQKTTAIKRLIQATVRQTANDVLADKPA